jgi:segregation and condensation protein B
MSSSTDAVPPEDLSRSYETTLANPDRQVGGVGGHESWTIDPPESAAPPPPPTEPQTPPPPMRIIEALLFTGGVPLTTAQTCEIIRGLTAEQFLQAVDALNQDYRRQGRPYAIGPQGQGYVLTLRPRYRKVVEKLYGSTREARLSPAAIDVLALVAYRQPATKQEVDSLRGAESGALLRQLVRRGLIAVVQRADAAQREVAYGTTGRFLELFGLASLEDLPRMQDLQQV